MIPLFVLACVANPDTGDSSAPDTDADTDTDTDTDVDTGTGRLATETRAGSGTVTDTGYTGTEEWSLVADDGNATELCRIDYTLTSIAARTDCTDCDWAWDLSLAGATLVDEGDPGCAATLGDVAALDGTSLAYGYASSYYGHAQVLMVWDGAAWQAVTFGGMDETTGAFTYTWEVGYRGY